MLAKTQIYTLILKGNGMMSEERQIKNFDRTGNTPIAWIASAESLRASVRILRCHTDDFDPTEGEIGDPMPDELHAQTVMPLLRGFGVECLLKALYLKKGCGLLARDGKFVPIPGAGTHDLVQISDVVSMEFSPEQRDVLKRLSIYMTSVGRYPIAKIWSNTKIQRTPGGGKAIPTSWAYPTDDEIVDGIEEMIMNQLDA